MEDSQYWICQQAVHPGRRWKSSPPWDEVGNARAAHQLLNILPSWAYWRSSCWYREVTVRGVASSALPLSFLPAQVHTGYPASCPRGWSMYDWFCTVFGYAEVWPSYYLEASYFEVINICESNINEKRIKENDALNGPRACQLWLIGVWLSLFPLCLCELFY